MKVDPAFEKYVREGIGGVAEIPTHSERKGSSFSSEQFDAGAIKAQPLTQTFNQSTSSEVQLEATVSAPKVEVEQQFDNSITSLAF